MQRLILAAAMLALVGLMPAHASEPKAAPRLARRLAPLIRSHAGEVAVMIRDLKTGATFTHRADQPMPTASLIKVAVMVEAYQQVAEGRLDLDRMISLRAKDKVPGSGILTSHFSPGAQLPLRDAIRLMMAYSDNTATNLVLDQIGLVAVRDRMKKLGYRHTKINAKVFRRDTSIDLDASKRFGLGSTTAAEMTGLFTQLAEGRLVSKAACREMKAHLLSCQDTTRLKRFLPPNVQLAHKTGAVTRVRCDAGVLYLPDRSVVMCVLTAKNRDRRWRDDNAANVLCARIGKIVYDHFTAGPNAADAPLQVGATGRLVEDLQRTVNARSQPSAEISVDGDFGSATKAAVQAFQRQNKLPDTGIVDAATWKALGPLITKAAPPPAPEEVNAEKLPRSPADPLSGPPHVTCKAWAIANRDTGESIAAHRADARLPIASTTKIMTAFVVLNEIEKRPQALQEVVEFSSRADRTPGSTAGIRAGERVTVKELLYGLLLPSGNDASVALAEHFGKRLQPRAESKRAEKKATEKPVKKDPSADDDEPDPLDLFVAAMNRTAKQLKMDNTRFRNPHGLTAAGHLSTCADLLKLARAAMQLPRFRKIVQTRQRGCRLTSRQGYERNVVWKNTNRLLAQEGYQGVKTGTTSAAGACLVSAAERDGRRLLLVVLGSASSSARYVDSRNLYRWAWREAAAERPQK